MVSDRWRVMPATKVDLTARDPASTDGAPGGKAKTAATFSKLQLGCRLVVPTVDFAPRRSS